FWYLYGRTIDDPDYSIWLFVFYQGHAEQIIVATSGAEFPETSNVPKSDRTAAQPSSSKSPLDARFPRCLVSGRIGERQRDRRALTSTARSARHPATVTRWPG